MSDVNSIGGRFSIRRVTDLTEFEKLEGIWNNLAEKDNTYMPFLSYDWVKTWLEHFLKE